MRVYIWCDGSEPGGDATVMLHCVALVARCVAGPGAVVAVCRVLPGPAPTSRERIHCPPAGHGMQLTREDRDERRVRICCGSDLPAITGDTF